jgi:maltose alpha-D-glucosyltransferase/alpha-amylase
MLRSFNYAVRMALGEHESSDLRIRNALEGWAAGWEREIRTIFLDAYRSAAAGSAFLPEDPDVLDRLVAVFELDKAVYELGYEVNNRPDWIWVPVQGIRTIMGGAA